MKKLSVIIPVYNVEKYIEDCLYSVLNQTFKEIEIILVNDGSTDNSALIIEQIGQEDDRIKIIKQKNQGLGSARNTGIKHSTTPYLIFIDSDDFIEKNMIEVLYTLAIRNDSDIVKCRYIKVKENGYKSAIVSSLWEDNNRKTFFKNILSLNYLSVSWDAIYKKSLFTENNLYFPDMYYEDVGFCFKLFYYAKKVDFSNDILYNWRQREGSITRTVNKKQIKDIFKIFDITYDFLQQHDCYKTYEKEFICRCMKQYNSLIKKVEYFSNNDTKKIKKYFSYIQKKLKTSLYFNDKNISLLKITNSSLFLKYEENRLLMESFLINKKNLQKNIYNSNIKLLKEQLKIDEYLLTIQKKFIPSQNIANLKNKFKDKRCFIVGLGPSSYNFDFSLLHDEYSFCFSNYFTKFNEFIPTFYIGDEKETITNYSNKIDNLDIPYKFISSQYMYLLNDLNSVYSINQNSDYERILSENYENTNFSFEVENHLYKASTSTHLCMQLAYYLGFKEVYLIGIDLQYDNPSLTLTRDTTKEGVNKIFKDFEYAKKVFEQDNRKIFNLSSQSALKMFEVIDDTILKTKES